MLLSVDSLAPLSHSVTEANGGCATVSRSFWSFLAKRVPPPAEEVRPAF